MDRQVVGVVFFGMVAMVAVVILPQLLDVVWCSGCSCRRKFRSQTSTDMDR